MKKIVIASAVAAIMASSTAIAETTYGGNIRLNFEASDAAGDTKLDSGKLTFDIKASEDLGNGMTAMARIEYEHDNADVEQTNFTNDLSYVGLKGDFGQVTLGVQDDAAGFACGATDIFVYNSGKVCGTGAANGPLDNAVVYANTFGAITLAVGATFDGDIPSGNFDGGQPAPGNHTVIAFSFDGGMFNVGAQITSPDSDLDALAAVTAEVQDQTVFGGSVKVGEMTIGLTVADGNGFAVDSDQTETSTAIALSMPLAGGTFKVGIDDTDDLDGDSYTNLQFDKSLSKAVYTGVQYSDQDSADDAIIAGWLGYKF